jgi:alpha-beta hydrolase superfamily lysophospholipase
LRVQFIRSGGHTSTIALWGRSMGAVTALLYSERDPTVAGVVLDSPFARLTDLMKELVVEQNVPLWGLVGGTALKLMRRCALAGCCHRLVACL